MKKLSKKELEFCRKYVYGRNSAESAKLSGYTVLPEIAGIKLLSQKNIQEEILRLEKMLTATKSEALSGYRRLSFGSISDAVRLITSVDTGEYLNPDELDLFMVSEIKKPKGGGMEIKFFDRQKALERLEAMTENADSDHALPFYKALESSAESAFANGGETDELL